MTDFRGPLPLEDRDFAQVRARVLEKIERRRAPIGGWALAAAAAVALIIILIPRPHPTAPHPVQAQRKAAPVIVAPPRPAPAPAQVAAEPVQKPKSKPAEVVADKGSGPSDEEITMNIQTADPNIRIIWISR